MIGAELMAMSMRLCTWRVDKGPCAQLAVIVVALGSLDCDQVWEMLLCPEHEQLCRSMWRESWDRCTGTRHRIHDAVFAVLSDG